jgi:hypothetical protein
LATTNSVVPAVPSLGFGTPRWNLDGLNLIVQGPVGSNYEIDVSTDLFNWFPATNFLGATCPFYFTVSTPTNTNCEFFRAVMSQ